MYHNASLLKLLLLSAVSVCSIIFQNSVSIWSASSSSSTSASHRMNRDQSTDDRPKWWDLVGLLKWQGNSLSSQVLSRHDRHVKWLLCIKTYCELCKWGRILQIVTKNANRRREISTRLTHENIKARSCYTNQRDRNSAFRARIFCCHRGCRRKRSWLWWSDQSAPDGNEWQEERIQMNLKHIKP